MPLPTSLATAEMLRTKLVQVGMPDNILFESAETG